MGECGCWYVGVGNEYECGCGSCGWLAVGECECVSEVSTRVVLMGQYSPKIALIQYICVLLQRQFLSF